MIKTLATHPNKKLTKEVALALTTKVRNTGVLCGRNEKTIDIQVKDAETGQMVTQTLSTYTVRDWIARNTSVIGTSRGFGDLFEQSKNEYRKAKTSGENKLMLSKARRNLALILDDDAQADGGFVGITSKRDPKTGKRIEVQRYKQKFTGTDPVKYKEKVKTTLTVLEKLDPAFKKDADTTVNVNLSFLALSEKRQEMIKLGKIKTQ